MMVYKCKVCGGATIVDTQSGIATCEYCGTRQALPLFTEDSEQLLYESGNNYLMHSEYDKAESVFNQLLTIRPNAAELYWDLVLCKYGVTYVKDPQTGNYVPTCNRTHYTPIFSDENYRKAIELAVGEKKALFEADAKTIDTIQKGIIAVSKKEKPFDVFISYKETNANGNRTKDSVEAQRLYEKLTEAGYKVFFSRVTLEDKVGVEYEPYIYAALHSSKVMLTVSSCPENMQAVWVKNEWSRFLQLRQSDSAKTLLPLYFDMEKEDLPDDFALLPAYNMQEDGFEEELLRGIKKLIPLPIMLAKRRKMIAKTAGAAVAIFAVAAGIAAAIVVPKMLEEKRLAEEQARLASEAAVLEKANAEAYEAAMTLFANGDYAAAEAAFVALGDYRDAAAMAAKCPIQQEYDAAMQLYNNGQYAQSAWAFAALGDYEDAAEQKAKAESSWRVSLATTCSEGYYITDNGTVALIKGYAGNRHSEVDISQNGKVVSVINNTEYSNYYSKLTVLHENGMVSQPDLDVRFADDERWRDIIKVSDAFRTEVIGLRADGTMAVLEDGNALQDLLTWENIVDFTENYSPGNGYNCGLIVGLKADGTLCATQFVEDPEEEIAYNMKKVQAAVEKFQNVKEFALDAESMGDEFSIVALTYDNKLLRYVNGKFTESNGSDLCRLYSDDLALTKDGDLIRLKDGKVWLRDVAYYHADYIGSYYSGGYAVTKSGSLYWVDVYEGKATVEETGSKTTVCEEWVSRLN